MPMNHLRDDAVRGSRTVSHGVSPCDAGRAAVAAIGFTALGGASSVERRGLTRRARDLLRGLAVRVERGTDRARAGLREDT